MAIADVVLVTVIAVLILRSPAFELLFPASGPPPTPAVEATIPDAGVLTVTPIVRPTELPSSATPTSSPIDTCEFQTVEALSELGLAGSAVLVPDDELRINASYPLGPGETADDAAQRIWVVFDVASAMLERDDRCSDFDQLEVTLDAQGQENDVRLQARVAVSDLIAYEDGHLSERAFINRVTYTTIDLSEPTD